MNEIVDFLVKYWKVIGAAIVVILEVVLLILKKRPVDNSLSTVLSSLVIEAEKLFEDGKDKLDWVITQARKMPQFQELPYWYLVEKVEMILKTPTKKGGCGRESD